MAESNCCIKEFLRGYQLGNNGESSLWKAVSKTVSFIKKERYCFENHVRVHNRKFFTQLLKSRNFHHLHQVPVLVIIADKDARSLLADKLTGDMLESLAETCQLINIESIWSPDTICESIKSQFDSNGLAVEKIRTQGTYGVC
jgi:hypothetical protein